MGLQDLWLSYEICINKTSNLRYKVKEYPYVYKYE